MNKSNNFRAPYKEPNLPWTKHSFT